MGCVLGVDLGLKRTGLAVSDALHIGATPLPYLTPKSRAEDIDFILAICMQRDVSDIVIGYPIMPKSEEEGMMAKRARKFSEVLQETCQERNLSIRVHLLDERYSSKSAQLRLIEKGIKKKNRKNSLDSEVACMLVEEYLSYIK